MSEFLYEAYRGELFGIEFFKAFAERAKDAEERDKWLYIVELEKHTATLLKSWLDDNGQPCSWDDPEMDAKGRELAEPWLGMEWQELMDTLVPWIEGYAKQYRQEAEAAPAERFRVTDMAAAHEEAIFYFVQTEQAGKSDSLKAVREFMTDYKTL